MKYILVKWNHSFPGEPVTLYSELDNAGYEVRKVEIYRDGHVGFTSRSETSGATRLGETPIPSLDEIAKDNQFEPIGVTSEEFESVWETRRK